MSGPIVARLHEKFCQFQVQAKRIQDRVEATQMPVDSSLAQELLEHYSVGAAEELRRARDGLRRGQWDIDEAIREEHDTLCISMALWELVHELCISTAPSPSRLLRWYNRHYLEEEIAEWWQKASQWAGDPAAVKADSPFWEPLYRLALSDCQQEVLSLLQRASKASGDCQLANAAEFLRKIPSLQQMELAGASKVEYQQAMKEIQAMAGRLLEETPSEHPTRQLLRIYAGCPQSDFEANKDVAAEFGRTWVEDVAYAHAWVLPDLRRTELGDLLRAVARRRTAETIDDIDRALFAVFSLDVPTLLQLLGGDSSSSSSAGARASSAEACGTPCRFPTLVIAHLVDVLYFAGRVPLVVHAGEGKPEIPPRDWHLMRYAKELAAGPRSQQKLALDYLRAGGSAAAAAQLERAAERLCSSSTSDEEMEEAVAVLIDLNLASTLGPAQCRRRAQALREGGDLGGCLRWACQAERYAEAARGCYVSELLDSLSESQEELEALLALLTPADATAEPLDRYPPESLIAIVAPHSGSSASRRCIAPPSLPPSGRLYFFVQFARCRALRLDGRGGAGCWAPALARLLAVGAAGPARVARMALEDELLPALSSGAPTAALGAEDALSLMRYVQCLSSDPLSRVKLSMPMEELHRVLGSCLSRAILGGGGGGGLGGLGGGAKAAPSQRGPPWGGLGFHTAGPRPGLAA